METSIDQEKLEHTLERVEAMEALAERILAECRIMLMMSFRFLDRALWKMPYRSMRFCGKTSNMRISPRSALATDGHELFYNAKAVIMAFRSNPDLVTRAYLHALLHCIFRHPFHTVRANVGLWPIACDACVESMALEMCSGRFPLEGDDVIERYAARIHSVCNGITPAKVYRTLLLAHKREGSTEQMRLAAELIQAADMLARDDHQFWDLVEPPQQDDTQQGGGGNNGDDSSSSTEPESEPQNTDGAKSGDSANESEQDSDNERDEDANPSESDDDRSGEQGDRESQDNNDEQPPRKHDPSSPPMQSQQQVEAAMEPEYSEGDQTNAAQPMQDDTDEEEWEQIAKQVETALQTMEKEHGDTAGTFVDNLALANRSRVNYEDFLRRFATLAEDAKLNDEEFDYIFYTYGLKLYENMPLVEPLEYKETERIREFAIAIDTSGSCSRGLTQAFLTRTYEILSRSSGFDEQINVHIIQCDAEIQADTVVHDTAELCEFEHGFEVRGLGGTDFRPVFAYVDDLIAKREFTDFRGVVYFTDGYGTFPTKAPDYDVAFVFIEEEGKQRRVPPWAMKVVLDEDTLYEMNSAGDGI